MRLVPGFTKFGGQIINGVEGDELRRLTKLLRRQLQARRLIEAEETLDDMLHVSRGGCDPIGMRKAVSDLYEREWEKVGLPNT